MHTTRAAAQAAQLRLFAAALFAAAFLLYANTIPNGYSLDDETVTRGHHETSRGLAALPEILTSPHIDFAGQAFDYRPVTLVSFALEHELFGENPHIGHFINALLYAITAVLLFRYFVTIFGAGAAPFAFAATLVFVVHPLHTEVVASLKNREEILALLFALVSGLSFLRYFDDARPQNAVLGFGCFFLALLCKLSAVPFVLIIPLSVAFRDPTKTRRAALLGAALVGSLLAYRYEVLSLVPALAPVPTYVENPLVAESSFLVRAGTALSSLLFYLDKLLIPYPLRFYYGYDTIPVVSVLSVRALIALGGCGALAVYAVRNVRTRNAAVLGILWCFAALAPYANAFVLAKGIVAERSAYVASAGFSLALAYAVFRGAGIEIAAPGAQARRRSVLAVAVVVILGFATLTIARNRAWADSFTLYETDLPRLQRSVMAHQIYARQLRREYAPMPPSAERTQHLERAIALSEQALAIRPAYAQADEHIGAIELYDLDRPVDAWPHLARASDLEPRDAAAHYDALYCSVLLHRLDDALRFGERLLAVDPNHVLGLFYMSKLQFNAGNMEKAFADNARLASVAPDRDLAYVNYGYFYDAKGDEEQAIANFERALAIAPNNPPVLQDLIGILRQRGENEKAQRYAAMAEQFENAARVSQP